MARAVAAKTSSSLALRGRGTGGLTVSKWQFSISQSGAQEDPMRTVTYGAACSLDGFIAGSGGEIDWLHMSGDVNQIMRDYWKSVDTILMGRKTWDQAVRMGGGGDMGGMSKIKTYVFSRT